MYRMRSDYCSTLIGGSHAMHEETVHPDADHLTVTSYCTLGYVSTCVLHIDRSAPLNYIPACVKVIHERLADLNLTAAELNMAKEPGMNGRTWHGQGCLFDEGYGILMLLGILTNPKEA